MGVVIKKEGMTFYLRKMLHCCFLNIWGCLQFCYFEIEIDAVIELTALQCEQDASLRWDHHFWDKSDEIVGVMGRLKEAVVTLTVVWYPFASAVREGRCWTLWYVGCREILRLTTYFFWLGSIMYPYGHGMTVHRKLPFVLVHISLWPLQVLGMSHSSMSRQEFLSRPSSYPSGHEHSYEPGMLLQYPMHRL